MTSTELSSKNDDDDSLSRSPEDAFEEGSHAITFEAFREFCRQHARALLPVFTLQRKVRSKIVSERFWKGCFDRRYGSSTTCFGVTKRRSKEDPPPPQIRLEHLSTMMRKPKTEGLEPWTENVTDNKNGATTADSETPEPSPGAMQKTLKEKGRRTGNHPGGGKERDKTKIWSNSERLVAAVEADRDKMSGPAKRARIRDSVTSATAQAKPDFSDVNSKLEAKGVSGGLRVSPGLNHSLAVEALGEEKKYAQRKGTATHKKRQSTLGAGDEGGGRHRRASSLSPLESKVSRPTVSGPRDER